MAAVHTTDLAAGGVCVWRCADDVRGRYGRLPRTHDRVNNWLWSGVGGCCGKLVAETRRYVRNSGLLRDMRGSNPELGSRLAVAVGFGLSEPAVVSVVPGSCCTARRGSSDAPPSADGCTAVVPVITDLAHEISSAVSVMRTGCHSRNCVHSCRG